MKKLFLILVGVALAAGILATAGLVYAATENPPDTETTEETDAYPPRYFMGRRGGGLFGFSGRGDGVLSDYMLPAIAEAFGLNADQTAAFEKVKETIQGIKDELFLDEIQAKMTEAFTSAASAALEDGTITQDQYDQMLERREQMDGREFGPRGGRGMRGGFGPGGFAGREGGVFQEYLDSALAAALDMSLDEFQTMKEDGFNLKDYAVENDMTVEALQNLMKEVHTNAIQAAFDAGAITEDQYNLMMEGLENSDGRLPFGPGFRGQRGSGW